MNGKGAREFTEDHACSAVQLPGGPCAVMLFFASDGHGSLMYGSTGPWAGQSAKHVVRAVNGDHEAGGAAAAMSVIASRIAMSGPRARKRSRRTNFWTLPDGVRGNSSSTV